MNDSFDEVKKEFGLPRTTDGRFTFDSVKGKELRKPTPEERARLRALLRRQELRKRREELFGERDNRVAGEILRKRREEWDRMQERNKLLSKPDKHDSPTFTQKEKEKLMDYYNVSPDDYREDPHYEMPGKKESEEMWRQEYGLTDWDKIY